MSMNKNGRDEILEKLGILKEPDSWLDDLRDNTEWYLYKKWVWHMREVWDSIRWAYQRVVKGYDDRVAWHLPSYINPMITASVEHILEHDFSYPVGLSPKEWRVKLKKILKAIRLMDKDDMEFLNPDTKKYKNRQKNIEEGLGLLAKHYRNICC